MLDFIGTVVISAVMVVNINAVINTMPGTGEPLASGHRLRSMDRTGGRNGKCRVAGASAAGAGHLRGGTDSGGTHCDDPLSGDALRATQCANAALGRAQYQPCVRRIFLVLEAAGRLSGPFPYSAGRGDVITGALALPAIWLAARPSAGGDRLLTI